MGSAVVRDLNFTGIPRISRNASDLANRSEEQEYEYIFDKTYIRVIFISLYTIVFCLCFFGNLLVILVVTINRRLRSITNFFLANLAVADFCVAIFCVYQNLLIYIVESWILGDFLCKMYMFIQSLSNTASVFILVVICTERYFAIIYPITCKQILTPIRLKVIIVGVWITCILYSLPKYHWGTTVTVKTGRTVETVCVLNRQKYNSEWFDMIHFVLLYVIPLAIMSLLYTRIAICLWKSSQQLKKQLDASTNSNGQQSFYKKSPARWRDDTKCSEAENKLIRETSTPVSHTHNSSQNILKARRGVIKMLVFVVFAFAICNLPFHARKMWQYWSPNYHGNTNFSAMLTPLTFLCTYFNSGINPLLYAFLSKNFRRGMREILLCSPPRHRKQSVKTHISLQLRRTASNRSTIKGNLTSVTVLQNEQSSECSQV